MRLKHPKTLEIISKRDDISKAHISRVWSEIFKWKASGKSHPKMFIDDDYDLGAYLALVYIVGSIKKCNLDKEKIKKFSNEVGKGFNKGLRDGCDKQTSKKPYFNDYYLFSDACSLYYKGINIFPDIFGSEWRKYVPVESHKEIKRQIDKTLNHP